MAEVSDTRPAAPVSPVESMKGIPVAVAAAMRRTVVGQPLIGTMHEAVEYAVAAAVREIEEQVPATYVAKLGEHVYCLIPSSRLDELPLETPLVARIEGTATANVDRSRTTVGRRLAEINAVLQVVFGPRPVRRTGVAGRRFAPLPQPATPDEAHGYAEQFGGA